jgi:hypothetical protein
MSERLFTMGEAATELGRQPDAVLDLIRCRALNGVAVQPHGSARERLRVPEAELDRWLRHRYGVDPATIRRRNREAFDRAYQSSVESAARIERKHQVCAAPVPTAATRTSVRSRETKVRGRLSAAETERLLTRKQRVEALVRRFHGRERGRIPASSRPVPSIRRRDARSMALLAGHGPARVPAVRRGRVTATRRPWPKRPSSPARGERAVTRHQRSARLVLTTQVIGAWRASVFANVP